MTHDNRIMGIGELAASSSEPGETADSRVSQWILPKKPTVCLKDVAGMEEVKQAIQDFILFSKQYDEGNRQLKILPGGGVLMYGPPGNGKTFIVEAIGGELDATLFYVSPASIKSKYAGEMEKNMRTLFEETAKHDRAVIFFDDIDQIFGHRGNQNVGVITEFLCLIDGMSEYKNSLLIVGATNVPWLLHDAVLRKFGKRIYVGMPDRETRKQIFELQFDGVLHEEDFPFGEFADRLKADMFRCVDIRDICVRAKKRAIARMIDEGADSPVVLKDDVFEVIAAGTPTVNHEIIKKLHTWMDDRE